MARFNCFSIFSNYNPLLCPHHHIIDNPLYSAVYINKLKVVVSENTTKMQNNPLCQTAFLGFYALINPNVHDQESSSTVYCCSLVFNTIKQTIDGEIPKYLYLVKHL